MPTDEFQNASRRILFEITVDDLIFLLALKHCGERKDGKREPSIPRSRSTWMIEDDHARTPAT
jgi:hypothetical protein